MKASQNLCCSSCGFIKLGPILTRRPGRQRRIRPDWLDFIKGSIFWLPLSSIANNTQSWHEGFHQSNVVSKETIILQEHSFTNTNQGSEILRTVTRKKERAQMKSRNPTEPVFMAPHHTVDWDRNYRWNILVWNCKGWDQNSVGYSFRMLF